MKDYFIKNTYFHDKYYTVQKNNMNEKDEKRKSIETNDY